MSMYKTSYTMHFQFVEIVLFTIYPRISYKGNPSYWYSNSTNF